MKYIRFQALFLALMLLLSTFAFSSCEKLENNGPLETKAESPLQGSEESQSSTGATKESERGTESLTDSNEPPEADRFADGTMIYYEGFDGYGNVSGNDAVLSALRSNGLWKFDDKTDPIYEGSLPYANKSTSQYALKDGKLYVMGYQDAEGSSIEDSADTYLAILDESTLWELDGREYTIQYDLCYESFANVNRYICLLWNYYGQYYNTFHLRVNGTGNLQAHNASTWLSHDKYEAPTNLFSGSLDAGNGTSIANKLLGINLGGSETETVFKNIPVTVRIRVFENGATSVWLSANGGKFVEVARYTEHSPLGGKLNFHAARCNGGALVLKTGAKINGTIDDIMIYMGHGDEPQNKDVSFVPEKTPDTFGFTQESTVSVTKYRDEVYEDFNAISKADILIPGLKQGMIPQGMDVCEENNLLFISGYFKDNTFFDSSVILTVDLTSGKLVGEYGLLNKNGKLHTTHVGGLAVTQKNVYISSGSQLYRIPLASFESEGRSGFVKVVETIDVPTRASFCNYSNGILWVGDFYLPNNDTYATDEWCHMISPRDNYEYKAACVGYRLTNETDNELRDGVWSDTMEFATPDIVLSIDQKIQGFTILGDNIVLSSSYGRGNASSISVYENVLAEAAHTSVTLNGTEIPVWFLDSLSYKRSYTAMPMAEGIAVYDGELMILFESGAPFFKDDGGKHPTDRVFRMTL